MWGGFDDLRSGRVGRFLPHLPLAVVTAGLAWLATSAVLEQTGGEPALPLDDAFIHFQFARSWVDLHPLVYTPGAEPTPGATSLLWPLVLAPFYAVGFRDMSLIWVAWALGWVSLALLAHDTKRLAERVTSPEVTIAAAAMVLLFGGYVWFAGSGMEVVPFSWLLVRTARRAAEWGESTDEDATPARLHGARVELGALGALTPLMRPEGLIATLVAVVALLWWPRRGTRAWALLPLLGPLLLWGSNLALTGQATSTTMQAKWLPYSPYTHELWPRIWGNVDLLLNTLLDGRIWSAVFVPQGSKLISWLALPALVVVGYRRGALWRSLVVLAVALGIAIPTTYDTFLVNRLRYLWPFAAAWFVALAALAEGCGELCARLRPELVAMRVLIAGGFAGALASHLSYSVDDLATSSNAIRLQQVALGRWARAELPPDAVIGVNDAGAIAYLSGRRTFDVVGLTTASEGRYWVAGAGSRFEHYERLGAERLPTHFIVYDSWFGVPSVLGEYLTARSVSGATILGDATKSAYRARYESLGSGALPEPDVTAGRAVLDDVDVADLESEAAHAYELFWAVKQDDVAVSGPGGRVDGGRRARTLDRFAMELTPGGRFVARLESDTPVRLGVRLGEHATEVQLVGSGWWEEVSVPVPAALPAGRHTVELRAPAGQTFTALHYWALR